MLYRSIETTPIEDILTRYGAVRETLMLAWAIIDWFDKTGKYLKTEAELTSELGKLLVQKLEKFNYTGAEISKALGAVPALREYLLSVKAQALIKPRGLAGLIAAAWAGLGYLFGTSLLGWFMGVGKSFVTGFLSYNAMWLFHALVKAAPDRALYIARQITGAYYVLPKEWAGFISEYLERLTGATIKLDDIKGVPPTGGTREAMIALGKTFLDPMLGLIMPTPEEAEADPMRGANAFMSANLQFQMSAWLLHLLGDTMSFGMFKSLKDLPNAISWSYGIGWLSWMVMGPVFRAGITAPMEKKFAMYYRQAPLGNAQIIDALYAGQKSAEEAYHELAEAGLKDKDIATMIYLSRKRFSEAQLEYMVKRGFRNRDQVIQYYKDMSYPQADAEAMAERLLTKSTREHIDKLVKTMEDLYKTGRLSPEELRRYYGEVNMTPEEQDLAMANLDLEALPTRELTDSQIARLYQQKVYTYEQALTRLQPRYADPQDAVDFLKLYPEKEEE